MELGDLGEEGEREGGGNRPGGALGFTANWDAMAPVPPPPVSKGREWESWNEDRQTSLDMSSTKKKEEEEEGGERSVRGRRIGGDKGKVGRWSLQC